MKRLIAVILFSGFPLVPALAADMDALKGEAMATMKKFGGALKGELQSAMKAGGPVNALDACNTKAPAITVSHSSGAWRVGRTSLKTRNPLNAPDAWEAQVLAMFEDKKAAGADASKLAHAEVVEKDGKQVFRFMKALPTAELCLNCHGADLKPEVAAKIDALYPEDKARGFKAGDIRGAFTLEKAL